MDNGINSDPNGAGPRIALPEVASKKEECHSQMRLSPFITSDPPTWVHTSMYA